MSQVRLPFSSLQQAEAISIAKVLSKSAKTWEVNLGSFLLNWFDSTDYFTSQTSGSTGKPKPISIRKELAIASAKRTISFFGLSYNQEVLLPMNTKFIGAKMMIVRAIEAKQNITVVEPTSDLSDSLKKSYYFVSMVPLQLNQTIQSNSELVENVQHILIGGAALDKTTEEACMNLPTAIWASYGMTETISHIALRRVNDENHSDFFHPLNGVSISLSEDNRLRISDTETQTQSLLTNDIVEMNDSSAFKIIGRYDWVINSGGIKLHPEELEKEYELLIGTTVFITSTPNKRLGEEMVLVTKEPLDQKVIKLIKEQLPKYHQPKWLVVLEKEPRLENGKLNRMALKKEVENQFLLGNVIPFNASSA